MTKCVIYGFQAIYIPKDERQWQISTGIQPFQFLFIESSVVQTCKLIMITQIFDLLFFFTYPCKVSKYNNSTNDIALPVPDFRYGVIDDLFTSILIYQDSTLCDIDNLFIQKNIF